MAAMTDETRTVRSWDGTPIAVFRSGSPDGAPLVLAHGTSADHTTFRTLGPRLADRFDLYAIDRRGRGASGDTAPYDIEREFEDIVAVATEIAGERGRPVDLFGHSYGGRCTLGAALRTETIRRIICYEGAPMPPGRSYHPPGLDETLAELLAAGEDDALLATFMRDVVGMSEADLAAYRANPVWPVRVAAAATIVREMAAELSPAASLDVLGRVRQPVLQLLGGESIAVFRDGVVALDDRLADGRVVVIPGARHAAHHTHVNAVVEATVAFLEPVTSGATMR
jgi:pimeloyl-ACP methyl ester carboxylesterase